MGEALLQPLRLLMAKVTQLGSGRTREKTPRARILTYSDI